MYLADDTALCKVLRYMNEYSHMLQNSLNFALNCSKNTTTTRKILLFFHLRHIQRQQLRGAAERVTGCEAVQRNKC